MLDAAVITVKVALLQVHVTDNKQTNLDNARKEVEKAVSNGAKLIVLPEMFQCPYANSAFPQYAETVPAVSFNTTLTQDEHPSLYTLSQLAKQHHVWIVGGSIPERETAGDGTVHIYNTSTVFSDSGEYVAKHRKVHLFDIDVPGKQKFKESDTLSAGNEITLVDTPYGKIGVAICYSLRFPDLFAAMRKHGVSIFVLPGAFNTTTGPLHWELLLRARATDYQSFMLACSPARDHDFSYKAWGHSSAISPWGEVLATTDEKPSTVYAELNLDDIKTVRQNIPTSTQNRPDLFKTSSPLDKL